MYLARIEPSILDEVADLLTELLEAGGFTPKLLNEAYRLRQTITESGGNPLPNKSKNESPLIEDYPQA